MIGSTVRRWLKKYLAPSRGPGGPTAFRPRLEVLEERECPAIFNIANGDIAGLAAAVATANVNNQADVINLAAGGNYTYAVANGVDPDNATLSALPVIVQDSGNNANTLTINGNGATIARSLAAATNFKIINIVSGRLTIDAVVISGGVADVGTFGGTFGGGIRVADPTNLTGALDNLVMRNSLITGNTSTSRGGGVGVTQGGKATIINSTISGNTAADTGGGVQVAAGALLTMVNDTVANNVAGAASFGGGISALTGTLNLTNSIAGNNHLGSLAGPANDLDRDTTVVNTVNARHSLIEALTGTINGVNLNNITGVDPVLGALQNNGGRTATHALLAGSPAINQGNNAFMTASFDQRGPGFNRIIGGTVDMGAYEFQPTAVTVGLMSSQNPSQVGQSVTFTASVQGTAANSNVPQGTVNFVVNSQLAASVALTNGSASFATAALPAGNHTVQANYNPQTVGDFGFSPGSSAPLTQTVTPRVPPPPAPVPYGRRWRR